MIVDAFVTLVTLAVIFGVAYKAINFLDKKGLVEKIGDKLF